MRNDADILRSPKHLDCPACQSGRFHTEEDWKFHPKRGTGQDLSSPKVSSPKVNGTK